MNIQEHEFVKNRPSESERILELRMDLAVSKRMAVSCSCGDELPMRPGAFLRFADYKLATQYTLAFGNTL